MTLLCALLTCDMFGCLSHDLLVAKLIAYGFSIACLSKWKTNKRITSKGLDLIPISAHSNKFCLKFLRSL